MENPSKSHAKSELPPIDDYFKTQRFLLLFIGVFPPTPPNTGSGRVFFLKILRLLLQIMLVLIMLHVAIVFVITFYLEYGKESFARISFAFSQFIIFSFATFSLIFMMLSTKAIRQMMDEINVHFEYRSAKGK